MTTLCRVIDASTSFPNTSESDLQPQVLHDVGVILADGARVTVRLMASDPGVAIDRVKAMSDEAVARLPRATSV